jgi:gamma-glutamyltranspeptidase
MAAQAGLDTLRDGGNAADAAVAVSLALGVCEPGMSGLGADGFFHHYAAADGLSTVFNGSGPAPAAAVLDHYPKGVPPFGPLSVSVPGKLGALQAMHAAQGSRSWAALALPAISLARDGFAATDRFCALARDAQDRLGADPRSAAVFLGKQVTGLVQQPDLARTLEEVAEGGAETFYRGSLARRLTGSFAQIGIPITADDLAGCAPEVTGALATTYRGFEIRTTPPNSTGFTMLQILKIIEGYDFAALAPADQVHLLVEAKKLAFVDRDRWSTDPRFAAVPVADLLSPAHARAQAAGIDMAAAAALPVGFAQHGGDTTYFCVVDAWGNAVSGIQSLASAFGAGVTAGDTGIVLNNRLAWWDNVPGHVNSMSPGKRISHTMNAPMVFRDGKLWCVFGTPGGDNQVQVNAQVLTSLIDLGADLQTAVERPR